MQALLALRQGLPAEAEVALEQSLALSRSLPYPYAEVKALYISGLLQLSLKALALARERLTAALAICDRLDEGLYRQYIERALAELQSDSTRN